MLGENSAMRSLYIQLIIVLLFLIISSVLSTDSLDINWLLGYVLYLSPFILLLICSKVSHPVLTRIYSYVSLFFVLVSTLLIASDQALFIVPALAWILLIFSLTVLVVTVLFKGLKFLLTIKTTT